MRASPGMVRDYQDWQLIRDGLAQMTLADWNELPMRKYRRFMAFNHGEAEAYDEEQRRERLKRG